MKLAWIYILIGVALLKVASVGSASHPVQQKLADVKAQIQMAQLALPVLRSMNSI